jgi:lipopolysaccharide/colanic/teichoic acid biosynthesis glycosyltransferase
VRGLHVCFFNRSYHPDRSATGQLLTELAEDLVRDFGCRVTIVAGPALHAPAEGQRARRRAVLERETRHGVEIVRARGTTFAPRRFAGRAANYLTYFASSLVAAWRVGRPDVVVALTDPPIIGLAAWLAARRARARFVFWCQDVFPEVARLLEDFHSRAVDAMLDRVNRFFLRRADRVVAVGETMRQRLIAEKGAAPDKVMVIHNWADCDAIVPGPRDNAFARAHGLVRRLVVMHSGNVGLAQELDTLLDAAARLRDRPELVVAIVGHGVKRAALEARVRAEGLDNVRFLPSQPKEGLRESFATADVFVVALKRGLAGYIVPSKLYGILAAGRPYVAAVEEACEVVAVTRKFDCGLLAAPGDPDALAARLRELCDDPVLRERLGENARRAALAFDRRGQVRAYAELLGEVVSSRSCVPREPALKRPFDVCLAGLGLVLSAPLWALIALAIRLEDGGPVFYAQERVGRGGRRFRGLKFRSMVPDADRRFGPRQAGERDPRVTRVGRLLRATAMDELPQLWNIFRGDMSFVGPRALMPAEIEVRGDGIAVRIEDVPGYEARHRVRPGLTGLAQIFADRDIPRRHKFRLDRLYIRRQSFWLDLRLIALSFWITVRGTWERRGRKL